MEDMKVLRSKRRNCAYINNNYVRNYSLSLYTNCISCHKSGNKPFYQVYNRNQRTTGIQYMG